MSISKDIWIKCDECGDMAFASHTAKQARKEAKSDGWVQRNRKDYCPRCARNISSGRGMTLAQVKDRYFPNYTYDQLEGREEIQHHKSR